MKIKKNKNKNKKNNNNINNKIILILHYSYSFYSYYFSRIRWCKLKLIFYFNKKEDFYLCFSETNNEERKSFKLDSI